MIHAKRKIWAGAVGLYALLACTTVTQAETLFFDDFESGVRTDVWGPANNNPSLLLLVSDGTRALGTLAAKQPASTDYYNMTTKAGAYRNPGTVAPGCVETATVQFWDDNGRGTDVGGGIMLANSPGFGVYELYQLGVYSAASSDPRTKTNYLWRTFRDGWQPTPVVRSLGWHELQIEVYPFTGDVGDVKFYIDGMKVAEGRRRETSAGSGVGFDLNELRLGISAPSNASSFWYDNVTLTYTPEPATLGILAIGSLCMLRRRHISG